MASISPSCCSCQQLTLSTSTLDQVRCLPQLRCLHCLFLTGKKQHFPPPSAYSFLALIWYTILWMKLVSYVQVNWWCRKSKLKSEWVWWERHLYYIPQGSWASVTSSQLSGCDFGYGFTCWRSCVVTSCCVVSMLCCYCRVVVVVVLPTKKKTLELWYLPRWFHGRCGLCFWTHVSPLLCCWMLS